ncbi:hypothetical protein Asp14428_25850 [Actinoplanes sp. NBRC 14428]|uniref:Uncharacterized protein DUF3224 n=1 Tax=Pseudosporangium ferrugineum TaxID=439699 RepID=A0A2T0S9Z3_9ACTN|nr:DUF3224 domain-containing protein [Pseudosporangium ferrugineum]PRY30133.1 uncharacterized protein DUF3224 [Pseudosporangium ferrugineum]BCJ51110.1 hypothetical protein Asp14428_25850 [Actinoplanes sp. NBRC 14428]
MTRRATGTFTTVFEPLPIDDDTIGRTQVLKTFEGDITGTGRAEMLSVGTPIDGSAGYVAIDLVDGTLHGHRGSFVLQHYGLMDRGSGTLVVRVVPDSGTDELTGLTGTFQIDNSSEEHRYLFDYEITPR